MRQQLVWLPATWLTSCICQSSDKWVSRMNNICVWLQTLSGLFLSFSTKFWGEKVSQPSEKEPRESYERNFKTAFVSDKLCLNSCLMRNGDNRRLWYTKGNFRKVLFWLWPEQNLMPDCTQKQPQVTTKLQLAAGPGPKTWSVFMVADGRAIIAVQSLNGPSPQTS